MRHPKNIVIGEKNSFAVEDLFSQAKRVIEIVLKSSKLTPKRRQGLLDLQSSILTGKAIDHLESGIDGQYWHKILNLGDGNSRKWSDPFHHGLSISYFHRLILDKIGYFETHEDQYKSIKQDLLYSFVYKTNIKLLDSLTFHDTVNGMLWGNKTDYIPPNIGQHQFLLDNQINEFSTYTHVHKVTTIDVVADNFGEEFVFDLLFIRYLIKHKLAKKIRYHLKNYPYNINDTTLTDFKWAMDFFLKTDVENFCILGQEISDQIKQGNIVPVTYPYTTLGYDWQLANNVLSEQFTNTDLIITKGDFNYRKNVGWYYWRQSDDYSKIISYLPAPLLCFRTIKNEILLGLNGKNSVCDAKAVDGNWWKTGVGGVILFTNPNRKNTFKTAGINPYWAGKCI